MVLFFQVVARARVWEGSRRFWRQPDRVCGRSAGDPRRRKWHRGQSCFPNAGELRASGLSCSLSVGHPLSLRERLEPALATRSPFLAIRWAKLVTWRVKPRCSPAAAACLSTPGVEEERLRTRVRLHPPIVSRHLGEDGLRPMLTVQRLPQTTIVEFSVAGQVSRMTTRAGSPSLSRSFGNTAASAS